MNSADLRNVHLRRIVKVNLIISDSKNNVSLVFVKLNLCSASRDVAIGNQMKAPGGFCIPE